MRLIDADKLLEDIHTINYVDYNNYSDTFDFIDNSPTIETEPVRHGEWIPDDYGFFHCSECQFEHDDAEYVTPYCPNCGAKMEDENETDGL